LAIGAGRRQKIPQRPVSEATRSRQ
jgi:hypothetical protein